MLIERNREFPLNFLERLALGLGQFSPNEHTPKHADTGVKPECAGRTKGRIERRKGVGENEDNIREG